MKKSNLFLVMVCLVGLWATSCVKDNDIVNTNEKNVDRSTTAQLLKQLKTSAFEGMYVMSYKVGHKSTVCGGKCTWSGNGWVHQDCMSYGSDCSKSSTVSVSKNIPDDITDIYYTATGIYEYEPTEDSIFYLPARSLYIENDTCENGYIWLNIPEQVLRRNEVSNQFIYNEISFTAEPLFENE